MPIPSYCLGKPWVVIVQENDETGSTTARCYKTERDARTACTNTDLAAEESGRAQFITLLEILPEAFKFVDTKLTTSLRFYLLHPRLQREAQSWPTPSPGKQRKE